MGEALVFHVGPRTWHIDVRDEVITPGKHPGGRGQVNPIVHAIVATLKAPVDLWQPEQHGKLGLHRRARPGTYMSGGKRGLRKPTDIRDERAYEGKPLGGRDGTDPVTH